MQTYCFEKRDFPKQQPWDVLYSVLLQLHMDNGGVGLGAGTFFNHTLRCRREYPVTYRLSAWKIMNNNNSDNSDNR